MNHYYAQYDDSDGVVVMFEHTENADLAMASRVGDIDAFGRPVDPALAGLYGFPMTPTTTSMQRFDPQTGERHEMATLYDPERFLSRQLSAFDWSTEGWLAPEAFHSVYHGFRPEAIVQRMLDVYGDRVDRALWPTEETTASIATHSWDGLQTISEYRFGDIGDLPSSPIFVPVAAGGDGRSAHGGAEPGGLHGWVVVPVMNDQGFRVEIFAADNVGGGPVCTLAAPSHAVPFILHSAWMPRAVPSEERRAHALRRRPRPRLRTPRRSRGTRHARSRPNSTTRCRWREHAGDAPVGRRCAFGATGRRTPRRRRESPSGTPRAPRPCARR